MIVSKVVITHKDLSSVCVKMVSYLVQMEGHALVSKDKFLALIYCGILIHSDALL